MLYEFILFASSGDSKTQNAPPSLEDVRREDGLDAAEGGVEGAGGADDEDGGEVGEPRDGREGEDGRVQHDPHVQHHLQRE